MDVALLAAREDAAVVRLLARIVGDLAFSCLSSRLVTGDVALAMFLVGVVDAVPAKG